MPAYLRFTCVVAVAVHTCVPVVSQFTADVVAATSNTQVYDLALLKLRNFNLSGSRVLIENQPKEGESRKNFFTALNF